MRICVSGAGGVGKSTFVEDFLSNWPSYKSSGKTYRNLIKEKKLNINKKGDQESQEVILNCLLDEAMAYTSKDNVIHDRGTIDNLVYSLWLKAKDSDAVSDHFLQRSFQLVKESMNFYDVIFYIPYNDQYSELTENVKKDKKTTREANKIYNSEIDNFFKGINSMYYEKNEYLFPFSTEEGVPALIEIFGKKEERIEIAKLYIDPDGEQFDEKDSLISDFLDPEEIDDLKKIMNEKDIIKKPK
jgi:predicted ATPase